ncbi:MAG: cytochrome c oxidase subunit I [Pseudomonadota bacterium]|nr:cytochrome c oxidase subunit I [Pseudomonadota bacterium]
MSTPMHTPAATALPYDDTASVSALRRHRALQAIWHGGGGWRRLASVNHNELGLRFLLTALVFFAIGGLLAMLIRAQLSVPQAAFLSAEQYNQVFTMHGTVMMFLFAIPVLEGMAIYLLPKLIGARDLAFPRLTAFGYWCYLFGGTIVVASMLFGVAPDSGWFMYTPLSSRAHTPGVNADVWLLGITFVEISAIAFAVEVLTSILKMRAPGMSLDRMPIFSWYIFGAAVMLLVGFPPLALGSLLLELERAANLPFFDPTRGGDALLWQHLFWLFGHPEVYIILLPAAGTLGTMIPVFARRPLVGYTAIVVAIIAMAFLSMGIWVHHMFTVGIPHLALAFFSIGSTAVAVPTAVQIFAWLGTLATGRPRFRLPMLYVAGFFTVFVCGGLTGVMLAIIPFNVQAHDSYFVVAHLHYVLVGGLVFPFIGALYYWLPHVTGRLARPGMAAAGFWLMFAGFNGTFLHMHLTGLLGMPRRVMTYWPGDGWTLLNLLSSISSFVMTIGFAVIALDLILQLRFGQRFRRDPWEAATLEWAMPTPPPAYALAAIPHIDRRADTLAPRQLGPALARGEGYLAGTRHGWQETLGVDATTGALEQIVILPRATFVPLGQALLTGAVVLSVLFGAYALAGGLAVLLAVAFVWGVQRSGLPRDYGPLPVGMGQHAPPHTEVAQSPPWVALKLLLTSDTALFASLVFGVFYLWWVAPGWSLTASGLQAAPLGLAALTAFATLLAAGSARWALGSLRAGRSLLPATACTLLALAVAQALGWHVMRATAPQPTLHAGQALVVALAAFSALHLAVGALMAVSAALRAAGGWLSPRRTLDARVTALWLTFATAVTWVSLALIAFMPALSRSAP